MWEFIKVDDYGMCTSLFLYLSVIEIDIGQKTPRQAMSQCSTVPQFSPKVGQHSEVNAAFGVTSDLFGSAGGLAQDGHPSL